METTDGFERHMREVLHGADDQAAGFTAARVIVGGQHRRRARTAAASGIALVAAGAVVVVPSALVGGSGSGHGQGSGNVVAAGAVSSSVSTTSASPGSTMTPSSTQAVPNPPASSPVTSSTPPKVRVVAPGTVDLGDGYSLVLTSDSVTVIGHGGQNGPHYTDNGNQASGSIGIQTDGPLVSGLYIGGGDAATGLLTVDGKKYPATIVTLAGHPGWSVAYAFLPTLPLMTSVMTISVADTAGHQLASFTNPPPLH